jgi:hypothetical protein
MSLSFVQPSQVINPYDFPENIVARTIRRLTEIQESYPTQWTVGRCLPAIKDYSMEFLLSDEVFPLFEKAGVVMQRNEFGMDSWMFRLKTTKS